MFNFNFNLLELTPKKYVLFIIGDWNAKLGSEETPEVMGKFGLGIRNEAGQRLIEFCQENALVITNTLFQQHCIGTWNIRSMNQGKLEVVKQEMARVNVNILGIRN